MEEEGGQVGRGSDLALSWKSNDDNGEKKSQDIQQQGKNVKPDKYCAGGRSHSDEAVFKRHAPSVAHATPSRSVLTRRAVTVGTCSAATPTGRSHAHFLQVPQHFTSCRWGERIRIGGRQQGAENGEGDGGKSHAGFRLGIAEYWGTRIEAQELG